MELEKISVRALYLVTLSNTEDNGKNTVAQIQYIILTVLLIFI